VGIFVGALLICQLNVSQKGFTLYWINFVPWDQIERVSPFRLLGLRLW